jgi:vacuolar protein sorting-associated protein 13A/C
MLAHKFVEKSAEAYQYAQENKKQSWWSFGWLISDPHNLNCFWIVKHVVINLCSLYRTGSSKDEEDSKSFTDEDWERLNRIIGYKENTEYIPDQQDMKLMQFDFEIRMKHNASKLTIDDSEFLADLSCQDFFCNLKMYPEAKIFDLKLGSYRLLSPYGLLAEVPVSGS